MDEHESWILDIRFTSSRLTISKKGAIVTHKNFFQHRTDDIMIYHRLICLGAENEIKWIGSERRKSDNTQTGYRNGHLHRNIFTFGTIRGDDDRGIILNFAFRPTPATNDHLYICFGIVMRRRMFRVFQGWKGWCGLASRWIIG